MGLPCLFGIPSDTIRVPGSFVCFAKKTNPNRILLATNRVYNEEAPEEKAGSGEYSIVPLFFLETND
jgi:hypothetical protein